MVELRPHPFAALVRRAFRELKERDALFDLPRRRFFTGAGERDLSVRFHGREAGTPLGPAAGPQSQMAQNLALSWITGSRLIELKTVQVNDELEIPRPCIDMQTVGFNVEWSQELRLEQSLEEYVKGAMLIEMLRASPLTGVDPACGPTIHDMSVGYDLAGIRSERVQAFLAGMRDCRAQVERLRREIPVEHASLRDLAFPERLSATLTLSTFHGCPPAEIEGMLLYLMREQGLNCVVKLNPMLLGPARTRELLNDALGYTDLRVPDSAFERDTQWEQMVDFVGRLGDEADALGLGFGVKFTNTLIVENRRGFFPASEREMYLSGPPLHVLAMQLVRDFRGVFGDRFPISFSAGIDRRNFADAVALGLVPVTVCSDLLKPGGYGRASGYLEELERRMGLCGARTIDEFVLRVNGDGGGDGGEGDSLSAARLRNTERYVDALTHDPRYHRERNEKVPRKLGTHLELFDCVTCDKCVPVCPNDANFTFVLPPLEVPIVKLRREGGSWLRRQDGWLRVEEKHQIANFADFCNECGNCDVFCPEDGGPYLVKPRFFGSLADFRSFAPGDGFHLERSENGDVLRGRFDGVEVALESRADGCTYSGDGFTLELDPRHPERDPVGDAIGEVDLTYAVVLAWLREAVYGPDEINPVSSLVDV